MKTVNHSRENILFLKELENKLAQSHVLSPAAEARNLIEHFSKSAPFKFISGQTALSLHGKRLISRALKLRQKGKPLAHIIGQAPFYGRLFYVNSDVLIPRPESEILLQEVFGIIDTFYETKKPKIVDVGTGSGCLAISLTLERPACRMTALDVSKKALLIAKKNLKAFGLRQIKCYQSNLFSHFLGKKDRWDIVVSNLPYIETSQISGLSREVRSEPRLALDGGVAGLDLIFKLLESAPNFLNKDGWIFLEIGKGQSRALAKKIKQMKVFENFRFVKDLNGIERVLVARI